MTDDEICALIALLNARVCEFERDFAYEVADAIVTGERPDLRDYEIEVSLHEVTTTVTAMTSLLARAEAAEAKLDEAVALLREARSDLAGYVDHDYPEPTRSVYPSLHRRWKRDMGMCWEIDATLARITEGEG